MPDHADHADPGPLARRRRQQQAGVGRLAPPRRTAGRSPGRPAAGRPGRRRSPWPGSAARRARAAGKQVDERAEVTAGRRGRSNASPRSAPPSPVRPRPLVPRAPIRGASASTAASTAALNSSTSSMTAPKSGSGLNASGRPPARRGVHTDDIGLRQVAAARAASSLSQPSGADGHGSPSRARSLLGSRTIEETPCSAHSSITRRSRTVLPEPEPAKTASVTAQRPQRQGGSRTAVDGTADADHRGLGRRLGPGRPRGPGRGRRPFRRWRSRPRPLRPRRHWLPAVRLRRQAPSGSRRRARLAACRRGRPGWPRPAARR